MVRYDTVEVEKALWLMLYRLCAYKLYNHIHLSTFAVTATNMCLSVWIYDT